MYEVFFILNIQKRWIHPGSGKTYNLDFNPPKVPVSYRLNGGFLGSGDVCAFMNQNTFCALA